MVKIGLLSDTHSHLDTKIFDYFKDVDEIWHAGDIGSIEVTDQLKKFKQIIVKSTMNWWKKKKCLLI